MAEVKPNYRAMQNDEPNYDKILKSKIDYYGETKAAYEFAANEFAKQKVQQYIKHNR